MCFMNSKRYPEEFKRKTVKQMIERGYFVADVAQRIDTTTQSLYACINKYGELQPWPSEEFYLSA